jgi:hypothetical protein
MRNFQVTLLEDAGLPAKLLESRFWSVRVADQLLPGGTVTAIHGGAKAIAYATFLW